MVEWSKGYQKECPFPLFESILIVKIKIMELHFFEELSSEDETLRNNAHHSITDAMQSPEYILFLIESLASVQNSDNLIIISNLLYIIYLMIKRHKYTHETIIPITDHLFQILLVLPYSTVPSILRCFSPILNSYPILFQQYIDTCVSAVISHETREVASIGLQFLSKTMKIAYNPRSSTAKYFEIAQSLFPVFIQIQEVAFAELNSPEIQKISCDILYNIVSLFVTLLRFGANTFNLENCGDLLNIILQILMIDSTDENIVHLKQQIITNELDDNLLLAFATQPTNVSEEKKPFVEFFITDYSNNLVSTLFTLGANSIDIPFLTVTIFPIFQSFIIKSISIENILSESVLFEFLFQVSKLPDQDVELLDTNPMQYYYFCVDVETENKQKCLLRPAIYNFLMAISKYHKDYIDYIFENITNNISDELDLESRLFILSVIANTKQLTEEQISELAPDIDQSTERIIILQTLNFYKTIAKNASLHELSIEMSQHITEMSLNFLLSECDPLVLFASADLFLEVFDENVYNITTSFDIAAIIKRLLELNLTFNQKLLQISITKLATCYLSEIKDDAIGLVSELLENWGTIASSSMEEDGEDIDNENNGSEILVSIANLIDSFPNDHFESISEDLINHVLQILQSNQMKSCYLQLSNILLSIDRKLSVPNPLIYNVFDVLLPIVDEGDYEVIGDTINLLVYLISKPLFFQLDKLDLCIQMLDLAIERTDLDNFVTPIMIVFSAIVQSGGAELNELVQRAFPFMNPESSVNLFFSATMLIVSGLMNNEEDVNSIPDEIITIWLQRIRQISKVNKRAQQYNCYGLTLLAKYKNDIAFANAAAFVAKMIKENKNIDDIERSVADTDDSDLDDENEEDYDVFDDYISSIIPSVSLPKDTFDAIVFFLTNTHECGLFEQMEEQIQNYFDPKPPST